MKTLKVARKFLVEMGREPQLMALTLLTPLFFILVFVVAYNRPLLMTHPIMVASQGDNIAGISLAQMVFAVCQVILVFLAIRIAGWQSGSLALSLSVGLALSFSAIGFGLIVACFIRNDSQALNIGSIVTMLQVFLSGSFFPLPSPTLFTLNDHAIGIFDIFPATHGMLALQQVVTYGAGWTDVRFRLGLTVTLSILYFIVSILVFQTLQMRRSP